MKFLHLNPFLTLCITLILAFNFACQQQSEPSIAQPNILLIVADDLGYADLGCYGGDIETDHIDKLAEEGIRFSRFHTSPFCAPTRAMLLSGNDNHIAGMGAQGVVTDRFGYEGHLSDRIVPIPALLQMVGYHTSMAGKWHLGLKPENDPSQKGFMRSFVTLEGAANHYDDQGVFDRTPKSLYTEDGARATWPKGAYSTDFYTDKLIEYIDDAKQDGKPFFSFAAYTSPHWPLQVDESHWKKYEGRYDNGYEVLKQERLKSLKAAGMIPEDAVLPPNHPKITPWDSLTAEEQKIEARKMELYAGMVDNLDDNIGRLINHLKAIGEYDNTLIILMSDNGAAAEDFYHHPYFAPFIQEHFNNTYENMGQANSFISYGPQWAEAGSSPFRWHKGYATEGGINTPMILKYPGKTFKNSIHHGFVSLLDLAPTFYELAKVDYPSTFKGRAVYPLLGTSLVGFLENRQDYIHDKEDVFMLEHSEQILVRQGDWKLVNTTEPFDTSNFELYKIDEDLAELKDLKDTEPMVFDRLKSLWEEYAREIQYYSGKGEQKEN